MGELSTSTAAWRPLAAGVARLGARKVRRLQHVLWSAVCALVLMAGFVLEPVDQFVWLVQSRIAEHKPSGDIVFAEAESDLAAPEFADRRAALAQSLRQLDRQGVGRVFIDIAFAKPGDPANDAQLRDAIADLGPRVVLVDRIEPELGKRYRDVATTPAIGGDAQRVSFMRETNYLGLIWSEDFSRTRHGKTQRTFAAALGNAAPDAAGSFPIDYGIPITAIPSFKLDAMSDAGAPLPVAGKTVVIGPSYQADKYRVAIPGEQNVPASYVSIYAAETLKAGRTGFLGAFKLVLITIVLLGAIIVLSPSQRRRWFGYATLALTIPLAIQLGSASGVRLELAYPATFLAIYSLLRWRTRWQDRAALFDPDTGLPTLRALEDWIGRNRETGGHVVIARIHGYEHVLRTLRSEDHGAYALKLADRLRAVDKDLNIYATGHYFGWHSASDDVDALIDHLTGLRAIFAAPVQVGEHTVDVGITFGIARIDGDPAGRIAAATAAVDETSEAIDPVRVASSGSEMDLLWDISLRARIDEAMEAGEIYCVYQPKIDIVRSQMIGVEALVRWHDPAKGFIPPMHFIQQCEKAGRMEHLTRYVLQSACTAGKLLHFRGQVISMSVNISATLLTDMRICGIVRNVLQATGFDPGFLVLEVTETSRITHFQVAATVLQELKALGIKISMDDFGVGASNYETFFELPFDEIKLDRLFVGNAVTNPKARAIVAGVVAMGHAARISVVAEGAETQDDLDLLEKMGCPNVQGFALSRPISLSNLLEFKVIRPGEGLKNIV